MDTIFDAEYYVITLLQKTGYFLFLVAMMVFFWGIVKYIGSAGDEKEREKSKSFIVGGLIAFAVLLSVWGLVAIIMQTFDFTSDPVQYIDKNNNTVG